MGDPRGPIDESFLVGGREHRVIVLTDPDPGWPDRFEQERRRIRAALGPVARRVEHVGSTAVPGLPAKPVVDVLVTLGDAEVVEDEARYLPALTGAGYLLRVREPGHRMFRTPGLDVHVHLWPEGAAAVADTLAFRDRLRADVADRELYAAVKRELVRRDWPTMNHYAEAKTATIRAILGRAGR